MKTHTYKVYATYEARKLLGDVRATSRTEANEKGVSLSQTVRLCENCRRLIDLNAYPDRVQSFPVEAKNNG